MSTFKSNYNFGGGACTCACMVGHKMMLMDMATAVVVETGKKKER
jgi:hypothetical protein